ncbi:cyclopropane-fatty-acyl-phospholipid synthase family protein [uncultured Sneathiella sp.]|uniref:cyclopropane-fatty-acyl-phospholipid synthase family protein n=1 Tax=uncultured Sneathiella sp. TaxID=879315 RepID=UPI0030EC308F
MKNSATTAAASPSISDGTGNADLRARLLKSWLRRIRHGTITVNMPGGHSFTFEGTIPRQHAHLDIHNMRVVTRTLWGGDTAFAESYMDGDWDSPDLTTLLMLGQNNADALSASLGPTWAMRLAGRLRHACRRNSKKGSRRNIAAHYDLGNDFYKHWLDETMTYSSALFEDMNEEMVPAQRRKYTRLAKKLDLKPGDRILEIGCGWGGFAEIAAREFGCHIVGLTLSREQAAFARDRMARQGLSEMVDIRIQDYRDITETFDKIVSIEMFEAVGEKYWPTFFNVVDNCLKPGGKAALQIITIDAEAFENYRRNPDFIQRYIFPGGMLPSPEAFASVANQSGFRLSDAFFFGKSYAETLRRWEQLFCKNWPRISPLGFDERFYRMWRYYLSYCEAGFDHGTIDVGQFMIERA